MNSMRNECAKPVGVILGAYVISMILIFILAVWTASPFSWWFRDTQYVLLAVLSYIVVLGIVWDGSLVSIGLICEAWSHGKSKLKGDITVESMRKIRFFTCGFAPVLMIVLTSWVILGTSNITLISLNLVGHVTHWRDPYLWRLEGPIIEWITKRPINVTAWDSLYHSAWLIEMFAAFVLIVIGRGSRIILYFCLSIILLFYFGRFAGLVNPIMGPAFFHPELFKYLDGSISDKAMHLVSSIMASPAENAIEDGGVLLGGVSAMPSLHVAMVAVTSYWLAVSRRWTLFVTVPWVLLVWTSTVVLGWHYILDGAGGIAFGAGCIWLTNLLLRRILDDDAIVMQSSMG
ncbi:MAG: phosphatase PAP2 family protein [Formivibrio sp.]|nr:phosphatase PAP2 family protein [Formivibrio sp.]